MTETNIDTILFDLDGTISDSAPGIFTCMQIAFDEHGVEWIGDDQARSLLGPPLRESFGRFVAPERVPALLATFRHHYIDRAGMFNATLYDGIDELIRELHRREIRLAVATSKSEPPAMRVLEHLGVDAWFTTIAGDTPEGARSTKALVIKEALWRLGSPAAETVLMIGDRSHDVEGAAAHGVRCVGVQWGYAEPDELEHAGVWKTVAQPADVLRLIGRYR
jgi:phosphoglycolate phosphatase